MAEVTCHSEVAGYTVNRVEVLITNGCADARVDDSFSHLLEKYLALEYMARGIKPRTVRMSSAGSVVNASSVRGLIAAAYHELDAVIDNFSNVDFCGMPYCPDGVGFHLVYHIEGHGDIQVLHYDHDLVVQPRYNISMANDQSLINCGMSHAHAVWLILADLLIHKIKPEWTYFDKQHQKPVTLTVDSPDKLLTMLQVCYDFKGDKFEDFIHDQDILQGPVASKHFLRGAVDADERLRTKQININAGVVNLITGLRVRLDGNAHVYTFLDDLARAELALRLLLPSDHPELVARRSIQNPEFGLIADREIPNARLVLARMLGNGNGNGGVAGRVFASAGSDLVTQDIPFGKYASVGIAYSVLSKSRHGVGLGIADQSGGKYVAMGATPGRANRIEQKLRKDPIIGPLFKYLGITVITMASTERQRDLVHAQAPPDDVREMTSAAIQQIVRKPHPKSALNNSILPENRRLLELGPGR